MNCKRVCEFVDSVLEYATLEILLTKGKRPNGGTVIFLRALVTSVLLYAIVVALKQVLDPNKGWIFNFRELQLEVGRSLQWFGAIFGAAYAALYARFSSQWTYLAGLYNQIEAANARAAEKADAEAAQNAVYEWMAGFLEDALELHLATKPLFASIIKAWGSIPQVEEAFVRYTAGGRRRFDSLMTDVNDVWSAKQKLYEVEVQVNVAANG